MYEIEDISLGHQELFTAKYPSAVNGYPSSIMDLYLGGSSFQEMLDIDIKNEMDNDVFGGQAEISFNFADMPDIDDTTVDPNIWFSNNSNHSNSNLFECRNEGASRMVNPNQVMPFNVSRVLTPTLASSQNLDIETPSPKRSHLTFSPASIEVTTVKQENVSAVKKDLTETLEKAPNKVVKTENVPHLRTKPIHILTAKTITKAGHSLLNTIKITPQRQLASTVSMAQLDALTGVQAHTKPVNTIINRKNKKFHEEEENPFPKPTYSYSCLIAMALKNSRTGSLPVSEIYNFMCEHFPYFKTAPNGWKNSVRHNLSLNKCFEKIEKPAVSGSQRKGCLWAMHPDKISKMDEEVQKWSRKDPAAIRRAMVYPEQLEALERGELKYGSDAYGDSSGSGVSDSEGDTETEDPEVDTNITIQEDVSSQSDLIEVNSLDDSCDEASLTDYDNDAGEHLYEGVDVENDDDALRVEIALAQQELFKYNTVQAMKVSPTKRLRTTATGNVVDLMYQPITAGRRKSPLLVRNNSNTSFIEIIGE